MEKKIKANITNLIKALKATAKAHKVSVEDYRSEGQFLLASESIPVYADVKNIVRAFYKDEYADDVESNGWGYITVWLYGKEAFREEVDEMSLAFALPYGEMENIKWTREK